MGLFVVISDRARDVVEAAIERAYPNKFYRMTDESWALFVRGQTSRQVSARIGFNGENGEGPGPVGRGAVFAVDAYWGRFDPNLWEWIRVTSEEPNG